MKAYKYKLKKPSRQIVQTFERWLAICQQLYNAGLQERSEAYRLQRKSVSFAEQCRELTDIRNVDLDVGAVYSQVGQNVLNRLNKAFLAFFSRVKRGEKPGYPRYRSRSRYNSFTYPQDGFRLEENKLYLSKIGTVKLWLHRPVRGRIKTCTIKRQADGWFVIFAVEENQSQFIPKTKDAVGIDVGIENYAMLSTGEIIDNPKYLRKAERELKIAQRKASKKKMRGANRRKAVAILAKKHLKITHQRKDFFHKLSLRLIKEFDEIAVENLNIKGLLKNHHLAKSISDAAWGTFIAILTFKAESAGRQVWKVPPQFTSQDCSRCGERVRKSLATREHRCIGCGLVLHRDHNAAINILARAGPLVRAGVSRSVDPRIPA